MSLETKINHSKAIIQDMFESYPISNIAVFASFGKDSIVVIDIVRQVTPDIQIVSVMTPYKFKETINYKNYLTDLWELNVKTYIEPELDNKLFLTDINKCCDYYKVLPTKKAIRELKLDIWITGLRNTEGGDMRKFTEEIEHKEDGLIKVNPILKWTEKDIWQYHALRNIPIHPLYLRGYRSLGCEPCSGIGNDNEPERANRWNGNKTECGMHQEKRMRDNC